MRKTAKITIDLEGSRDVGKTYLLTELSAEEAEDWLFAFIMAAARSGVVLPPNLQEIGLAGVATLSLQALGGMRLEEARPLLAKMFSCVQFVSSDGIVRALVKDDIEEVSTRLRLRKEVVELHTGFFGAAKRLSSASNTAPSDQAEKSSSDTPTSPVASQL